MDKQTNDTILKRVLGPADPELLCDECFEKLDEYVDLELRARRRTSRFRVCGHTSKAVQPAARNTQACARWLRRASPTPREANRG